MLLITIDPVKRRSALMSWATAIKLPISGNHSPLKPENNNDKSHDSAAVLATELSSIRFPW